MYFDLRLDGILKVVSGLLSKIKSESMHLNFKETQMAMKLIRGLNECGKIFSVIFLFRAVGFESQTWRDDIFLSLSFQCRILFWPPGGWYFVNKAAIF